MVAELIIHLVTGWVKVWSVKASFKHHFSGKPFLWEDTGGWLFWPLCSLGIHTGIYILCFLNLLIWLVSSKLQALKVCYHQLQCLPHLPEPIHTAACDNHPFPLQNATQTFHASRSYTPVTDQWCQSGTQHPFSALKQALKKESWSSVSALALLICQGKTVETKGPIKSTPHRSTLRTWLLHAGTSNLWWLCIMGSS